MDEHEACQAGRNEGAYSEAALYVHVKWETRNGEPLLCDNDIRQAAYAAAKCCARRYRCRTLAIGGTPDHVHAIFRFPASVPISVLVRQAIQASGEATAQYLKVMCGRSISAEAIWANRYGLRTLGEGEVSHAVDYVEHQAARHAQGQTCEELERVTVPCELRLSPHESNLIREKSGISYFPN